MNNFMCRATGITLLCLASTLSALTQGAAGEPPLRGQALVKAVIGLARDGEALIAEMQKLDGNVDSAIIVGATCTMKKRDDWLAEERKGLAVMRSQVEVFKRAASKIKPRQAELTERLAAFRKLTKEHPEAGDNPIAGIEILLEAAEGNVTASERLIDATLDQLSDGIAKLEGADYATAKRCSL